MYAHTSTEPYTDACMTNRLLSLQCTYTHPLFCLPPHAPVRPCVTCICLLYIPTGGNLRGTRSGSTHPDSTLRTRQRLRPATRDEAPERWSQEGCDVCRYPTCSPLVHECRMVSTYAFRYKFTAAEASCIARGYHLLATGMRVAVYLLHVSASRYTTRGLHRRQNEEEYGRCQCPAIRKPRRTRANVPVAPLGTGLCVPLQFMHIVAVACCTDRFTFIHINSQVMCVACCTRATVCHPGRTVQMPMERSVQGHRLCELAK